MKYKTLALAAVVVGTVLGTADTADAQYRARRTTGYSYAVPYSNYSYSAPYSYGSSYSYGSTYSVPAYNGVTSVGTYTPLGGTQMIIPSGGFYSAPSTSYYTPSYGSYYNNGFYNNSYYNNSFTPGINISPSGVNFGGRNWRW